MKRFAVVLLVLLACSSLATAEWSFLAAVKNAFGQSDGLGNQTMAVQMAGNQSRVANASVLGDGSVLGSEAGGGRWGVVERQSLNTVRNRFRNMVDTRLEVKVQLMERITDKLEARGEDVGELRVLVESAESHRLEAVSSRDSMVSLYEDGEFDGSAMQVRETTGHVRMIMSQIREFKEEDVRLRGGDGG